MKDLSAFKDILSHEWSPKFEELRKMAMINSFYRYGPVRDNYEKYKCLDACANIEKRLEAYKETGNTEYLVDVANFAMCEFMYPSIPNAKYVPTGAKSVETVGAGINEIRSEAEQNYV